MRMASEDRRRQLPWVALGLAVTLTAAIIFALWASALSSRTAVAVVARDIPAGSTVQIDDLRAVEMASGQGAAYVPMTELESVVGRTVRSSIPEGAFLHPSFLSASSPIERGAAVVGAVLQAGEYPITHLSPGQFVGVVFTNVFREPGTTAKDNPANRADAPVVANILIRAEVAEISQVQDSGQESLFVSLLTSADDAVPISRAAAANELRLILLSEESRPVSSPLNHESTVTGAVR